jgi:hypothetical protein
MNKATKTGRVVRAENADGSLTGEFLLVEGDGARGYVDFTGQKQVLCYALKNGKPFGRGTYIQESRVRPA